MYAHVHILILDNVRTHHHSVTSWIIDVNKYSQNGTYPNRHQTATGITLIRTK